jgi:hypothetical protein
MCYHRAEMVNGLVIAQYLLTAASSGFNAGYFLTYRSDERKHRVGAAVLAILSLAVFIESSYFGAFALFQGKVWAYRFFLAPEHWFLAHLFLCLSSLLITTLILRQLRRRGND